MSIFNYKAIRNQLKNYHTLSKKYGQFYTIKNWNSVDGNKKEIPWYTYPAIEYIKSINFKDKNIFEYGSGNSSIYWANRSKSIISVEDNKDWFIKVKSKNRKNHKIEHIENKENYINYISKNNINKFDIIIIDGKYRIECAEKSVSHINPDGIIILDNSDRKEEKEAARFIRNNFDCIQVDFHGFGPINSYTWTTSIFFSRSWKNDSEEWESASPLGSIL